MYTITIGEYSLDEEFFIPGHLRCEELDRTLYRLLLLYIHEGELCHDVALVLILLREESYEVRGRLYTCLSQLPYIDVRSMQEGFGEKHYI